MDATRTDTSTQCRRCGRVLRSTRSIARGYGRHCHARVAANTAAAASLFSTDTVNKAAEVLELGAIVRDQPGRYRVVSSAGDVSYQVDVTSGRCTCRAGQFGRRCYHLAAAVILAA